MEPLTIYHTIATLRMRHQLAQEELKIARARAEQDVIDRLNGSGKNDDERKRQLTIGLSSHHPYQLALSVARSFEEKLLFAEADLEVLKDTRRQDEWTVRARLVNALERRAIFAEQEESAEAVLEAAQDREIESEVANANGTSGGDCNSDWYAGRPRSRPTYSMLTDEEIPF